jgi:hypothetical protein
VFIPSHRLRDRELSPSPHLPQLIGNYARLPTRTLSIFSLSYLASRVAYNFLYYYTTGPKTAFARSSTYFFGCFTSLWVLFKSAKKVYDL